MSDLMIRNLAIAAAEKLAGKVEAVVQQTIREQLPSAVEAVLREQYPGETVRIYVPRRSLQMRRERDAAIRAMYNGHNAKAIAHQFGISARMVFNIVGIK
jgi:Mor family transcriptional regulator